MESTTTRATSPERTRIQGRTGPSEVEVAQRYDSNASGTAAPHTDDVSRREVADLFSSFTTFEVRARNFDWVREGR